MNTIPETIGWHIVANDPPPKCQVVLTFDGRYMNIGIMIGGDWYDQNGRDLTPKPTHWATVQGPKQPA